MRSLRGFVFVAFGVAVGSVIGNIYDEHQRKQQELAAQERKNILADVWREHVAPITGVSPAYKECVVGEMVPLLWNFEKNQNNATYKQSFYDYKADDLKAMNNNEIRALTGRYRDYIQVGGTIEAMMKCQRQADGPR